MNNESKTLWISLVAGIFAAFLLYSYSQEKKAEFDKTYGSLQSVVVARVDISEMQQIDDTLVEIVQKPKDFMEPLAITDPELAIGQVASSPIKKGEQILQTKLLRPGPDTGISLQVAPSKRAVTLPVDEMRGVAKLIRPADRVDIFAAIDSGKGASAKREVSLLMQDVVVLATGVSVMNNLPRTLEMDSTGKNINQISLTGDTKYTSITIEATPKEAQDLIYIMSTSPGNLFFTLRNPNDRAVQPRLPSSSSETVLGRPTMSLDSAPQNQMPAQVPQIRPATPAPANRSGFQQM